VRYSVKSGSQIQIEIACAFDRGRIQLDRHWKLWFRYYLEVKQWQEEPIDLSIMEEAYSLPEEFHADSTDRIITAAARLKHCALLTADRKLVDHAHANTIWRGPLRMTSSASR